MALIASLNNAQTVELNTQTTITIESYDATCSYKITYVFGGANGEIEVKGEMVKWTPPLTLANQIPNATSGVCTLSLSTYDKDGKYIGRTTGSMILTVPESVVPTMAGVYTERINNTVPESWRAYVQGISQVRLEMMGVQGAYGSSIVSYMIEGEGFTSNSDTLTTGVLLKSGTNTFRSTIIDSRGRSNTYTTNIYVLAYEKPKFTEYYAKRCNSSGTVIEGGTYGLLHTVYTYSSLNNLNPIDNTIQYREVTAGGYKNLYAVLNSGDNVFFNGNLETDKNYEIKVTLKDTFYQTTITLYVSSEIVTMDFGPGGLSVAIGKTADKEKVFEVSNDWRFYYRNYELLDIFHPVGDINLMGSSYPRHMSMSGGWTRQGNTFSLGGNTYSIWKRTS